MCEFCQTFKNVDFYSYIFLFNLVGDTEKSFDGGEVGPGSNYT
jgi:hypothetical protein